MGQQRRQTGYRINNLLPINTLTDLKDALEDVNLTVEKERGKNSGTAYTKYFAVAPSGERYQMDICYTRERRDWLVMLQVTLRHFGIESPYLYY